MKRFWRASGSLAVAVGSLVVGLASLSVVAEERGLPDTGVVIKSGDRTVLDYRYQNVPFKPYVAQLFSPAGTQVLRDSPSDHKHHHGLMFAVWADGVNFWEEKPDSGKENHRGLRPFGEACYDRPSAEGFSEQLDWTAPNGDILLNESRKLTVYNDPTLGATLLTWTTQLQPAAGKQEVKLGGAEYNGLGMRFPQSMDITGDFLWSDTKDSEVKAKGRQRLTRSAWCAYCSAVDGKPVTVAMFDHPANPRHPATMFTLLYKPFSYLSATLHLAKEPLLVTKDHPLALRYGVAVWDGNRSAAEVQKLYDQWLQLESADSKQ